MTTNLTVKTNCHVNVDYSNIGNVASLHGNRANCDESVLAIESKMQNRVMVIYEVTNIVQYDINCRSVVCTYKRSSSHPGLGLPIYWVDSVEKRQKVRDRCQIVGS